ncbi:hypothetical protein [Pyxidicoccus xibeiensis]|uniref:hypothetical protein n=1 Tax=Pyxidicoccus xibeiensis TaxID=2906759 RepID=UPI0020A764BB|nr:hypothetical protein [Pyxidicoccus xibeiensis]MCP3138779.1 hypothetical protein [Pyxidicoccus xibeiensis]
MAKESGPSLFARLLLVLIGIGFLGAAWVWSRRSEPWAARLVEEARRPLQR